MLRRGKTVSHCMNYFALTPTMSTGPSFPTSIPVLSFDLFIYNRYGDWGKMNSQSNFYLHLSDV